MICRDHVGTLAEMWQEQRNLISARSSSERQCSSRSLRLIAGWRIWPIMFDLTIIFLVRPYDFAQLGIYDLTSNPRGGILYASFPDYWIASGCFNNIIIWDKDARHGMLPALHQVCKENHFVQLPRLSFQFSYLQVWDILLLASTKSNPSLPKCLMTKCT